MGRRIRLTFADEGVSAVAELLEEAAPRTCQTVWEALPLEHFAHHGIYSGSEIAYLIPKEIFTPQENATSRVATGDVGYWFQRGGEIYGVPEDLSELAWFYDRDAVPSMASGPIMMNIFAQFSGDASAFYAVCRRMRREGAKRVRVERVEG
jgi:hypothetical protein